MIIRASTAATRFERPRPQSRWSSVESRPSHRCGSQRRAAHICGMTLFAIKPIATLRAEAEATGEHALVRALGPLNLVTLGIGAVIGAGIFVITGQVAALYAG